MKHIKTFENFLNEANDLSYWKSYDKDNTGQSPDWMSKEAKTTSEVVALIDKCIKHWNDHASKEGTDRVSKPSEKHISDLAMQYFKQFKSINGHIIDAMIMQES
jgi:hypothetical protein